MTYREEVYARMAELRESAPPIPAEWSADKRCDACKYGRHDKCTGVDCYGPCTHSYHEEAGSRGIGLNARGLFFESSGPTRSRTTWADW